MKGFIKDGERGHRDLGPSRRCFLKGIGAGTIATIVTAGRTGHLPNGSLAQAQTPQAGKGGISVQLDRSRLPVLRQVNVIVIGGSVAGVAAALQFARAGYKVVVVEHRMYLGREISATLKPWVDLGKLADSGRTPELIAETLKTQGTNESVGEIPLWMDAFKVTLENLLLEAGVDLIYATTPTEVRCAAASVVNISLSVSVPDG